MSVFTNKIVTRSPWWIENFLKRLMSFFVIIIIIFFFQLMNIEIDIAKILMETNHRKNLKNSNNFVEN